MIDLIAAFERVLEILEGKLGEQEPPLPDAFSRWVRTYGLSTLEVDMLLLALLPEVDSVFCETFSEIQGADRGRPMVGLATDVLAPSQHRMDVRRELLAGPLWSAGFLTVAPEHPFFEQPLLPGAGTLFGCEELVPAAVGETSLALEDVSERGAQHVANEVERLQCWSSVVRRPIVVVPGQGAHALAAGFSSQRRVLRAWGKLETGALEQLCLLASATESTLLLEVASDTRLVMPAAARWTAPIVVAGEPAGVAGDISLQRGEVGRMTAAVALQTWRDALGEDTSADLYALAAQTHLTPDQIYRVAEVVNQEEEVADVGPILRTIAGEPRSPLATTVEPRATFDDLIVSARCQTELDRIVQAVRLRTEVEVDGELPPNIRGLGNIVTLFHGDSGTGKTLAAEALARRLEMPLMVVDVSRVTSKYVGETEERLEALFQEAEGFRALLFLDEADSFFGARTEISDSNDRYANLETNYLLQRIERFEGIVVLATNLKKNIDDAFTRRFRFIVAFDKPVAHEQLAIWGRHLPATAIDQEQLTQLSRTLQLVGGDIRKIAVSAIFDAAARHTPLDYGQVARAISSELTRAGRRVPDALADAL